MGRSTSINNSTAIDNRLAVTDNAFGLSSSGNGNNTALRGSIFNLSANGTGGAKGAAGSGGGTVNLNVLDGGAINKAFDFAAFNNESSLNFARSANNKAFDFSAFSLSAMLDGVINGQKTQQAASQYQADAIGAAVRDAAAVSAAGNAYVGSALAGLGEAQTVAAVGTAAQAEVEKANKQAMLKKLAIGAAVLGVGWYLWKGSK